MTDIDWNSGAWTNTPARVVVADDGMHVTAVEESDAWRITSYGFVHHTEHALLEPFAPGTAMELSFRLDFSAQFDQAGIFVKVDDSTWIKTGVERSDGEDSLGAVVTRGVSDWSLSPVPGWRGRIVTIRVSRSGDAVTIRALPLCNFGVSQHFKTYVDLVLTDPRMAPGQPSPIAGKPTVPVTVQGGNYAVGTPREGWDHATAWMRRILEDVWQLDLEVVT